MACAPALTYSPPPVAAVLPLTVQLVAVAVPPKLEMPPPWLMAELPLRVLLMIVSVALL